MDLQQEQVDFNKNMWLANTVISGTQAAVSLTNAAVGLGKAIGDYHDQQANLSIQTNATQYQAGVTEAITNGYDPYVIETGENGQQIRRYVGYDNYTLQGGTKLGDLKQQAIQAVGEKYWTKSGTAQGMQIATNAFENIELAAQRQTADAVIKNRQNVFSQELTNAINTYQRTGDATQLNTVIDGATWMSPDQKQATTLEAERLARYGNVQQTASDTAKIKGISETEKYLNGITDLSTEEKSKILAEAQQVSSQTAAAAATAAKEKYQQSLGGGSTIGNAYRAAIANAGDNPAVNEAIKKAAQAVQFESLSDRFGRDLAGVDAKTTQELESLKKTYEGRQSDYQDQGMLYKQQLDQINREIEQRKVKEPKSGKPDAENAMANIYVQFNNKEISGPSAIRSINQLRELSPLKAAELEAKILGGGTNSAAEQTYLALDGIIRANTPGTKESPDKKMEYEKNAQDLRQTIFQAYYDGVRGDELTKLVEGYRKEAASKVLQEAFSKGTIGSTGLFGTADKTATAFAYHSNQGNLDLRYSERTTDARRPDETSPLTVGGAKAEQVLTQAAEQNQQWANKVLEGKGIQLTSINYEKDSSGDRDGRVTYKGSDGNTYRVNADSENGKRYIERLEDGKWKQYTPKQAAPDNPQGTAIDVGDVLNDPNIEREAEAAMPSDKGRAAADAVGRTAKKTVDMVGGATGSLKNSQIEMRREGLNRYGEQLDSINAKEAEEALRGLESGERSAIIRRWIEAGISVPRNIRKEAE